jgi:phosphoglycerate dehydrogenase-like enzyme
VRDVFGTGERVYCKADVLADPDSFRDTEYFFSTWGIPVFTEEELAENLPNLKALVYGAGSVQHFARPFLNRGIKVFSAWAANAVPVAEYTVAQIILANKGFYGSSRINKAGDRKGSKAYFAACPGNYGVKVGIIGVGTIGRMVAERLKGYTVEVLAFDPFLPDVTAEQLGIQKVDLAALFSQCDVISNHLADNEQTKGILNGALFEKMRPYATFLNTGRGAQVVEEDLIRVLQARPDLTAVLDVTDPEPPVEGSPFYTLPNCVLTPHIAGSSGNEVRRLGDYMKVQYENFTQGKPYQYEITLEMLKNMA